MRDIDEAYRTIKSKARRYIENVPLATPDNFQLDGENSEITIASKLA